MEHIAKSAFALESALKNNQLSDLTNLVDRLLEQLNSALADQNSSTSPS